MGSEGNKELVAAKKEKEHLEVIPLAFELKIKDVEKTVTAPIQSHLLETLDYRAPGSPSSNTLVIHFFLDSEREWSQKLR